MWMSRLPRDLSHDRLVRWLRKEGCQVVRAGAKHTVMDGPNGTFTVPRHAKLKTGTVAAILRQAGVEQR